MNALEELLLYHQANYQTAITTALEFVQQHPIDVPKDCCGMNLDNAEPILYVWCQNAPDDAGRDKLLATVGQAWGTTGWTRESQYASKPTYNWTKKVNGVRLHLNEAEILEHLSTPVAPNCFPLLLEDTRVKPVTVDTDIFLF